MVHFLFLETELDTNCNLFPWKMADLLYISLHDEEWGVPVYDDQKLFELLVFSQALAELSWPAILNKRVIFR